MRRIVTNFGLVLAGIMMSVGLMEAVVRVFAPQVGVGWTPYRFEAYRGIYRLHPTYGYEFIPSLPEREDRQPEFRYVFTTSRQGLRDSDIGPKTAAFRIIGVGDSMTFGSGVESEQTYLRSLARLLRDRYGAGTVEVFNAGVNGYGTGNEYFFLKDKLLVYEPNLVIVGFFVGNDVFDNADFSGTGYFLDADGYLRRRERADAVDTPGWAGALPVPFKPWLRRHSHAYYFLIQQKHELAVRLGFSPGGVAIKTLSLHRIAGSAETLAGWETTWEWLDATRRLLREGGQELLLLVIPTDYQVNVAKWNGLRKFYRLRDEDYELDEPQRLLQAFCQSRALRCLDLLPELRRHREAGESLYYQEGHLNARGHGATAEAIFERIVAERLLSSRGHGAREQASNEKPW